MIICDKFSYNHYKKIFDSKNKLYDYIRSHECEKLLVIKSIAFHNFNLLTFVFIESIIFKNTITFVFLSSTSL